MTDITIYHNPRCGTSRRVLETLRARGIEPRIVEYLKTPLSRDELARLVERMGVPPRDLLRGKETLCAELGLDRAETTGEEILDSMARHPILMNRPVVASPLGVRLCRPAETVLEILPEAKAS